MFSWAIGLPSPMAFARANGEIVFANRAATRRFGSSTTGDTASDGPSHRLPPLPSVLVSCVETALAGNGPIRTRVADGPYAGKAEAAPYHPAGPAVAVIAWTAAALDEDGRVMEVGQLARLAAALQRSRDAIIITDAQRRIEWVSHGFTRITGYALEEVIGRDPGDILQGPETDPESERTVRKRFDAGQGADAELINYRRTGERFWCRFFADPLVTNGRLTGWVGIMSDVTEDRAIRAALAEAREEAEEFARMRAALLTDFNHELRTPLTAVVEGAHILAEEASGTLGEFADAVRRNASWLQRLVDQVTTLSQINGGEYVVSLSHVPLSALLRRWIDELSPEARERGLGIALREDPSDPFRVITDERALRIAVQALLGAAIRTDGPHGLTVTLSRASGGVTIEIRDSGSGTDPFPGALPAANAPTGRSGPGRRMRGLGMALVEAVAARLGGFVEIADGNSSGAQVRLRIPEDGAAWRMRPAEPATDEGGAGPLILHVEDRPDHRILLERLLAGHARVVSAATAESAIEIAQEVRVDGFLINFNLRNRQDGISVLQQLRRSAVYELATIVAVAAFEDPSFREQAEAMGFDGILVKPFTRDQVLSALAPVLPREAQEA